MTNILYCECSAPVMDVEHDEGCRRCGRPVDFSPRMSGMTFKRIAAGDYQTPDGRYLLWQVPGVWPPAWNVEDTSTNELLVDGAASKRDAVALLARVLS